MRELLRLCVITFSFVFFLAGLEYGLAVGTSDVLLLLSYVLETTTELSSLLFDEKP